MNQSKRRFDIRRQVSALAVPLQEAWKVAPRLLIVDTILMVLMAMIPTILLIAERRIVNHVADRLGSTGVETWTTGLIAIAVMYAVVSSLSETTETTESFITQHLRDTVSLGITSEMMRKIADYDSLELHENPELLDRLRLAHQGTNSIRSLLWFLFSFAGSILALIPLMILVGGVAWWIPITLILAITPGIYLNLAAPKKEWAFREATASQERQRDLLFNTMHLSEYARDVRLFELGDHLVARHRSVATPILQRVNGMRLGMMRSTIGLSFQFGLLVILPILWVIRETAAGELTIGDFAMTLSAIGSFRLALWGVTAGFGQIGGDLTGIEKYRNFMQSEPTIRSSIGYMEPLPRLTSAVSIDHVAFAYPGSETRVLDGFSLTLREGESAALVGANGAGKTTIARLLGRLFDPTEGSIRWDDADIRDTSPGALRHRLAFVPQDFAQFPVSLRENIAFGRLNDPPTDEEIVETLRKVGLDGLLTDSDPLSVPLTKELDGGRQLSGGQWQRVAIARAMIRAEQADLVIMDEPTAALDPNAEIDIVRRMLEVAHGKTSLIISHRLGICTLVDRVIVLDDGKIVEDGSHRELMARGGPYAEMFRNQAGWYQERED